MSPSANPAETQRLPWSKREDGEGFRALPDGPEHPDRIAEMWFVPQPYAEGMNWAWSIHWGRARRSGQCRTSQEASDDCNRHWHEVEAEGQRLAEANRDLDMLMSRVDEVARTGAVDLPSFGFDEMDGTLLLHLVKRCRDHWEKAFRAGSPLAGIEMLMAAGSAELHKRRMEGRPVERQDGTYGQFLPRSPTD